MIESIIKNDETLKKWRRFKSRKLAVILVLPASLALLLNSGPIVNQLSFITIIPIIFLSLRITHLQISEMKVISSLITGN
jgi:hypothetical protein